MNSGNFQWLWIYIISTDYGYNGYEWCSNVQ